MQVRVLLAGLAFVFLLGSASADNPPIPATPGPGDCVVVPLTDVDLYNLMESDSEPAGAHDPSGQEADPADVAAVTETVLQSIACTNANQPLAALALCTDRYIVERFSSEAGQDELGHLIAASSRTPKPASPEDRIAVESIGPATLYADGRIGIGVQTSNAEAVWQDIVILAEVDDRWLIDEVLLGDETILKATPASGG